MSIIPFLYVSFFCSFLFLSTNLESWSLIQLLPRPPTLFTLSHMRLNTTVTRGPWTSDSQGAPMQPRPAAQRDSTPGAWPLRTPAAPIHRTEPRQRRAPMHQLQRSLDSYVPLLALCPRGLVPHNTGMFRKRGRAHSWGAKGEAIFLGSVVLFCSRERRSRKEGCEVEPFGTVWAAAEASATKQCLIFSKSYTFCHNWDGTKPQHKPKKSTENLIWLIFHYCRIELRRWPKKDFRRLHKQPTSTNSNHIIT